MSAPWPRSVPVGLQVHCKPSRPPAACTAAEVLCGPSRSDGLRRSHRLRRHHAPRRPQRLRQFLCPWRPHDLWRSHSIRLFPMVCGDLAGRSEPRGCGGTTSCRDPKGHGDPTDRGDPTGRGDHTCRGDPTSCHQLRRPKYCGFPMGSGGLMGCRRPVNCRHPRGGNPLGCGGPRGRGDPQGRRRANRLQGRANRMECGDNMGTGGVMGCSDSVGYCEPRAPAMFPRTSRSDAQRPDADVDRSARCSVGVLLLAPEFVVWVLVDRISGTRRKCRCCSPKRVILGPKLILVGFP